MKRLQSISAALIVLLALICSAQAQRAASVGDQTNTAPQGDKSKIVVPEPPPAPPTVKAKYEGGVIGYKKSDGSLNFDDANSRLLFRDKLGKEVFSVPYAVVVAAYADTKARQPGAARVIGSLPLPYGANIPAWFVKTKHRYLTLHYSDPDTHAQGLTSFKLENKEILASVLHTLGKKAGLTQRGDAYVRRREASDGAVLVVPVSTPPRPDDEPKTRPNR